MIHNYEENKSHKLLSSMFYKTYGDVSTINLVNDIGVDIWLENTIKDSRFSDKHDEIYVIIAVMKLQMIVLIMKLRMIIAIMIQQMIMIKVTKLQRMIGVRCKTMSWMERSMLAFRSIF